MKFKMGDWVVALETAGGSLWGDKNYFTKGKRYQVLWANDTHLTCINDREIRDRWHINHFKKAISNLPEEPI